MDQQPGKPREFARLEYFLRGYLHQDWKQEHGSLQRAAQQFCDDLNPDERSQVLREWHEFVESTNAQPLDEIARRLRKLGSAWQPSKTADLDQITRVFERHPAE
jgi:hypothetical protein